MEARRYHRAALPMQTLKRHARLLYLLALCQVLGGPLVLGGLLLLAEMTSGKQIEARVAEVLQRFETAECATLFALAESSAPEGKHLPRPANGVKTKTDKGWSSLFLSPLRVFPPVPVKTGIHWLREVPPPHHAQAPPLPPPRLA